MLLTSCRVVVECKMGISEADCRTRSRNAPLGLRPRFSALDHSLDSHLDSLWTLQNSSLTLQELSLHHCILHSKQNGGARPHSLLLFECSLPRGSAGHDQL